MMVSSMFSLLAHSFQGKLAAMLGGGVCRPQCLAECAGPDVRQHTHKGRPFPTAPTMGGPGEQSLSLSLGALHGLDLRLPDW